MPKLLLALCLSLEVLCSSYLHVDDFCLDRVPSLPKKCYSKDNLYPVVLGMILSHYTAILVLDLLLS